MHDWATQQAAAGMAAAIPAAAGVAASGLYSTWVNYRQPPPPLTEPLEHLRTMGHSIFERYDEKHLEWEVENARAQQRYAEDLQRMANDFYDANFTYLDSFWREEVQRLFITEVNPYAGRKYNSKTFATQDKLADRFPEIFKRGTTTWRNLTQARAEITNTLRNILDSV